MGGPSSSTPLRNISKLKINIPEQSNYGSFADEYEAYAEDTPPLSYWASVQIMLHTFWPLILANTFQWYQFSVYGYLIPEIEANIFPNASQWAWIGFALTFVMRPLGGILFGWVADRFGRKISVTAAVVGMVAATVCQGCPPSRLTTNSTVALTIGLWLMIICRMLQGIFAGGLVSGASVTIGEGVTKDCLGMAVATLSVGGNFAFFLSSGIVSLLHSVLSPEQMMSWGWRVPFLITIFPGLISLSIHLRGYDKDVFEELPPEPGSPLDAISHFWKTMRSIFRTYTAVSVISILGSAAVSTLWYVGPIYTCDFVVKYCHISPTFAVISGSLAQLMSFMLAPFVGWLTDQIGAGKVMLIGTLSVTISGLPVYYAIVNSDGNEVVAFAGIVLVFGASQALSGTIVYLWALELFDMSIRSTGLGVTYNLAVSYFGGCAPLLANVLTDSGSLYAPGLLISLAGLLSTVTLLTSRWMRMKGKIVLTHIRHYPY